MASPEEITDPTELPTRAVGPVLGLVAAAVSLSVAELVAGLSGVRSPVIAVGDGVIDVVPSGVKTFAIATFGTNDKLALLIGIVAILLLFAAGLGTTARRSIAGAVAGLVLFAGVGIVAGVASSDALPNALLPAPIGAAAGIATLVAYRRVVGVAEHRTDPALAAGLSLRTNKKMTADALDRRQFLFLTAGLTASAAAVGYGGRWLSGRVKATASRLAVVLPRPFSALPPIASGTTLGVPGVVPFVTPNSDFYRIDIALSLPQVSTEGWELKIKGMVDRPLNLTFEDLLARRLVETDITLVCVSNAVGGGLIGNARWLGVPLKELLNEAGVNPATATQVVGRSVDDYECGFPTSAAFDGRDAIVALGMNGEPLPIEHGFPARLVVAGLYGYVSATKWLKEIELTTLDGFDSYWVPRGWAKEAPIKTESRIDTPRRAAKLRTGANAIAGVSWAQTRGISKVEVRIDRGEWQEARLGEELNRSTWRQWVYEWDAPVGAHTLSVRATDGAGEVQTAQRADPIPDGASGWHSVAVTVV